MMSFQAYFLKLAEYNQWANQQLYAVLNTLDDSQLHQLQPNFFDSIIQISGKPTGSASGTLVNFGSI